jgi:hypothetical protein
MQTTQTQRSPLEYEDYRDLPDRITVRWLQSLTDEELREVMRCVDEEQDYWQDYSHARVLSDRWHRVYAESERRGVTPTTKATGQERSE